MSSPRRPATTRRAVERWTSDIDAAFVKETPVGYSLTDRQFACVPWREHPTRTTALRALEFANPVAYALRAEHKYVNSPFYLEPGQVLQADQAMRASSATEQVRNQLASEETATRRREFRLREEMVRQRQLRKSKRIESVTGEFVRPHSVDTNTGRMTQRSGEYSRIGVGERTMGFAGVASEQKLSSGPIAVKYRVNDDTDKNNVPTGARADEGMDAAQAGARALASSRSKATPPAAPPSSFVFADFGNDRDPICVALTRAAQLNKHQHSQTESRSKARPASAPVRPKRVTPGERVLLIHGPQAGSQKRIATKKTSGARGGALAAKTQSHGYSFGGGWVADDAEQCGSDATHDGDGPQVSTQKSSTQRPPPVLPKPPAPAFAARTATVTEKLAIRSQQRRPASARAMLMRYDSSGMSRDSSGNRFNAGSDNNPEPSNPKQGLGLSPKQVVDARYPMSEIRARPGSGLRPNSARPAQPYTARLIAHTPNTACFAKANPSTDEITRARLGSSLAELELGARGDLGPGAFVFGHTLPTNKSPAETERGVKHGEFARGYRERQGAWVAPGQGSPMKPTWR
jgi:hypothetical protein